MYTIVMDTLNMLMDGLRATLPYSVALWLLASMYRSTRARRQRPSLRQLIIICYAMLLLWGTCFSRVHSVREFFNWSRRDFSGFFVNEFSLTSRTAIWHELMNVLLFVPLGFFCASYMRPERGAWVFALMGFALSCTVESFQGFHGLVFDIGDIITNTLGAYLGCLAYRQFALMLPRVRVWLHRHRRVPGRT